MKSGYHSIHIEEADRHKTRFTCRAIFYQWRFVPFGLKNAPALFQKRMDFIFGMYDFIITYIDDILIHSRNLQMHLAHLEILFQEVRAHGIVLSEKKMVLFQNDIDFLGIHVIYGHIQMELHVLTKLGEFHDELKDTKMI